MQIYMYNIYMDICMYIYGYTFFVWSNAYLWILFGANGFLTLCFVIEVCKMIWLLG